MTFLLFLLSLIFFTYHYLLPTADQNKYKYIFQCYSYEEGHETYFISPYSHPRESLTTYYLSHYIEMAKTYDDDSTYVSIDFTQRLAY